MLEVVKWEAEMTRVYDSAYEDGETRAMEREERRAPEQTLDCSTFVDITNGV